MARGKGKGRGGKSKDVDPCALGDDKCKKPDGRITWVCCDGCSQWYHCNCVNVDHKEAADMVFHCEECKPEKEQVGMRVSLSNLS